ncbi:MAG: rhomboid family intramembrane serine protease [Parachlamydiales bacterium]
MNYHNPYQQNPHRIGPAKTSYVIKLIIFLTLLISLSSTILTPFFKTNYFVYYLGLSLEGIKNYFFWQLVTYNFIESGNGLSLGYIFQLLFNLYLLWVMGTTVIERTSRLKFIFLFFSSIIFSGLVALITMHLTNKNIIFAGSNIGLFSILVAWMMLNSKETRIFLFFILPIKAYWIVLGLIGLNLLSNFSNMQMVPFFTTLTVSLYSYFYSVVIWNRFSPLDHLNRMERYLIYTSRRISSKFNRKDH